MKRSVGSKILLIILFILLAMAIYALYKNNQEKPTEPSNPIVEPENNKNPEPKVEPPKVKETYLNKVTNSSGYTIKDGWQDIIVKYLDAYTKSLVYLDSVDVSNLFTNPDSNEAYLTNATIDFIVEHHKMQPNDMKLKDAYYDIEYKSVKINDNKVTIVFLEDDYHKFNFISDDITSRVIDVENTIVINKSESGVYTLDSVRTVKDHYVMFTNVISPSDGKVAIDNLKNKYLDMLREEVNKNKSLLETANTKEYEASKTCDHEYNRVDAVAYADKYADARNSEYYDFSKDGGNCANYVSQSIHAGGVPMDYKGDAIWKYYSANADYSNNPVGRTASWTAVNYFYRYARDNSGFGLCSDIDINIFYGEPGDVLQVGYNPDNPFTHTTIVVDKVIKDGKVVDLLLDSNTVGLYKYPALGYTYQNKRLIKILGYND